MPVTSRMLDEALLDMWPQEKPLCASVSLSIILENEILI